MRIITAGACQYPLTSAKIHTHNKWEIILVTSGDIHAVIDSQHFSLTVGDIQVIPPFTPHGVEPGAPFTDMFVSTKTLEFDSAFVLHDHSGSVRQLFPLIIKATLDPADLPIAESLLDTLVLYITRYRAGNCAPTFASTFKNILNDNISNADFDIADAIKGSGFSEDHFRRRFTAEYGVSPAKYLRRLRISEAKKLLYQSPYSVTEIAHQCGFSDVYYFSHCFKHETGTPPLDYRKKAREDDPVEQNAPAKTPQTDGDAWCATFYDEPQDDWADRFHESDCF